mmetsp:Transcript_11832/g.38901  ORF Transcript_11832/g.38901 Transcript_11832/m.38901 type:complete len:275 (-) Transcript_11832:63-887(-)
MHYDERLAAARAGDVLSSESGVSSSSSSPASYGHGGLRFHRRKKCTELPGIRGSLTQVDGALAPEREVVFSTKYAGLRQESSIFSEGLATGGSAHETVLMAQSSGGSDKSIFLSSSGSPKKYAGLTNESSVFAPAPEGDPRFALGGREGGLHYGQSHVGRRQASTLTLAHDEHAPCEDPGRASRRRVPVERPGLFSGASMTAQSEDHHMRKRVFDEGDNRMFAVGASMAAQRQDRMHASRRQFLTMAAEEERPTGKRQYGGQAHSPLPSTTKYY